MLVTHLHGDHVYGLPGLLSTLQLTPGRTRAADGSGAGILVVGPRGLRALLAHADALFAPPEGGEDGPVRVIELEPGVPATGTLFGGTSWCAVPVPHAPDVAAHAFVVREAPRPPRLDAARALALGARGAQLGALQRGCDVTLPDGRTVRAADVLHPRAPPRCIVVTGDHAPLLSCDGASDAAVRTAAAEALAEAAQSCAVLVDECTFPDGVGTGAGGHPAGEPFHSTPCDAAALALRVGAHTLALTHFSQRIVSTARTPDDCTPATLVAQTRQHLTVLAPDARVNVIAAEDYMELVVPELEEPSAKQ